MILDALFSLFRSAVETVLGWLPVLSPPVLTGMVASMAPLWGYLAWANKYVPLIEAAGLIGVLGLAYVGIFVFKFSVWVLTKAHLLGGSSGD